MDASDISFRSQLEVTQKVLSEVGASEIPSVLVLNKRDRLSSQQVLSLSEEFRNAIMISTRDKEDLQKLRDRILSYFETDMVDEEIFVPYQTKGIIGEIRGKMKVISESYDEQGVKLVVRSHSDAIQNIRKKIESQR